MASSPKVGLSSAVSGSQAPAWVPGAGRHGSSDPIEAMFGSQMGVSGGWHPGYDDGSDRGFDFFSRYAPQKDSQKPLFTPLMGMYSGSFPASDSYSETRPAPPIFLTDLMRAVGIYEFNLRAISGTLNNQGSVINRYG